MDQCSDKRFHPRLKGQEERFSAVLPLASGLQNTTREAAVSLLRVPESGQNGTGAEPGRVAPKDACQQRICDVVYHSLTIMPGHKTCCRFIGSKVREAFGMRWFARFRSGLPGFRHHRRARGCFLEPLSKRGHLA